MSNFKHICIVSEDEDLIGILVRERTKMDHASGVSVFWVEDLELGEHGCQLPVVWIGSKLPVERCVRKFS